MFLERQGGIPGVLPLESYLIMPVQVPSSHSLSHLWKYLWIYLWKNLWRYLWMHF